MRDHYSPSYFTLHVEGNRSQNSECTIVRDGKPGHKLVKYEFADNLEVGTTLKYISGIKDTLEKPLGMGRRHRYVIWDATSGELAARVEWNEKAITVFTHEDWTTPFYQYQFKVARWGDYLARLSPSKEVIYFRNEDETLFFRSIFSSRINAEFPGVLSEEHRIQFSQDESRAMLITSDFSKGMILNLITGSASKPFDLPERATFYRCTCLPANTFAILTASERLLLLDGETGRTRCALEGFDGTETQLSASSDSKRVTIRNLASTIIWDANTGKQVARIPRFNGACFEIGDPKPMTLYGSYFSPSLEELEKPQFVIYQRRRPEAWWGIAWLPESWVLLAALIGLSVQAFRWKARAA